MRFGAVARVFPLPRGEQVLARGQRDGEFRDDLLPRVVAVLIRDLLSGALQRLLTTPDLDVATYTRELVMFCRRAVGNPDTPRSDIRNTPTADQPTANLITALRDSTPTWS